ncbi:MAG: cytochrome c3 family protein [Desulfovibrionaceae bacterium]|nr:cytochrome c3 family protein [Desulfovibrionaceae bacterium]
MKRVLLLLSALFLLGAGTAQADVKEIAKGMKEPIVLESTVSPLLNVTFNHRSHMAVPCKTCHHEEADNGHFVSCRSCHSEPGPRNKDEMSQFQAFHAKDTDRSCYGCHQKMHEARPADFPHFTNCRPCHMSDKAREAARAEVLPK